jgi:DNA-binding GntR family transcriptional regulator
MPSRASAIRSRPETPLSRRASAVYRALKQDLIMGRIRPGGMVHEVKLAGRFRVSKSPVRDALSLLRAEGYVDVLPRRGYVATHISLSEVQEVFALRALLEGEAAAQAARRDGPRVAARLETLEAEAQAAYRAGRPEAYVEANRRFHLTIAEAAGSRLLAQWIAHLLDRAERIICLGVAQRPRSEEVYAETDALIAAVRGGDPEEARRAMVVHIENMRRRLLALDAGRS